MKLKTLKSFLEVYKPKSPDEQRFVDKHVTIKHADRNGNGDDLFNAKNIKKADRKKDRHGYEPGEDAKVYESIEASLLEYFDEIGEEISESELAALAEDLLSELSNQTLKSYIKKAGRSAANLDDKAAHHMDLHRKWTKASLKDAALNRAGNIASKSVKRTNNIIKAAKKIKEEAQLDEISQKMARAYRDKAGEEREIAVDDRKYYAAHRDNIDHENNVIRKRTKGIETASNKIRGNAKVPVKESNEELDELLMLTIEDLSAKDQALILSLYENLELDNQISLVETLQEENGINEILDFVLESELNELSKKTLNLYLRKAEPQRYAAHRMWNHLVAKEDPEHKSLTSELSKKTQSAGRKALNRDNGVFLAKSKINKLKEEALNESPIAGTRKISSHEGKNGHTHEIRYDRDNEEYSVHHYLNGKHLGEGPVSYHSDKEEAKDQVAYDVKHFKR